MNPTALKCPNCAADLPALDQSLPLKCEYCGGSVVLEDAGQSTMDQLAANLLMLARHAHAAGNFEEAGAYYTRTLELAGDCSEAWIGKGIAAGWQSDVPQWRLAEFESCVDRAIALAGPDVANEYRSRAASELNNIVGRLDAVVTALFTAYVTPETYQDYLARKWELISWFQKAAAYKPDEPAYVHSILNAAAQYMGTYNCSVGHRRVYLSSKGHAAAKAIIVDAQERMRKIDPTFTAAVPEKGGSGCYIATAVYGDYDCAEVRTLRRFRDDHLALHPLGRAFIAWYYRVSPALVARYGANPLARKLARALLDRIVAHLRRAG